MNVPDPDGTRRTCVCGQPTVIAEPVPGQPVRVHCGTHDNACDSRPSRNRGAQ